MVKSWVCPRCLGDLNAFYIEEGDTMVSQDKVVCPNCGYTLHGAIGECCKDGIQEQTEGQIYGCDKTQGL